MSVGRPKYYTVTTATLVLLHQKLVRKENVPFRITFNLNYWVNVLPWVHTTI